MVVQVYAVVKEKQSSKPSDTICASRQHRESLVYSSLGNSIEIRVVTNPPGRRRHKADYFAIRYQCSSLLAFTLPPPLFSLFSSLLHSLCCVFFLRLMPWVYVFFVQTVFYQSYL